MKEIGAVKERGAVWALAVALAYAAPGISWTQASATLPREMQLGVRLSF